MSYLTPKRKVVLERFARTLVHGVIAAAITYVGANGLLDWIDAQQAVLLTPVVTAILMAADKAVRFGSDPGESA